MKKIILILIYLLPKSLYGSILKRIFETEKPAWIVSLSKKIFVGLYKIDLTDAEFSIEEYRSVQELFCRRLKKNVRIACESSVISPVDGLISQTGKIVENTIVQAKGIDYKIHDLLPEKYSNAFEGGWYATLYLAPYNYHRIHSPVNGRIKEFYYQPGKFFPVNSITVPFVKKLFVENERLTTFIETEEGTVAVVKVAALGVGNIKLSYCNTEIGRCINNYKIGFTFLGKDIKIKKLDELGIFAFGSTVILVCDKGVKQPDFTKIIGKTILTGESLNR